VTEDKSKTDITKTKHNQEKANNSDFWLVILNAKNMNNRRSA